MKIEGFVNSAGALTFKVHRAPRAPLSWRIRNALRWAYIAGMLNVGLAKAFSKLTGIVTATSELKAVVRKADGRIINYGVLSRKCITTAGMAFLVDDMDSSATEIDTLKYHGCGTGVGVEAAGDVALVTECTNALNPDNTRANSAKSQPTSTSLQMVGTLTFDVAALVIEHGIFSQAATGGGTLLDRSVFLVLSMDVGD
jgi:hypothetical protein